MEKSRKCIIRLFRLAVMIFCIAFLLPGLTMAMPISYDDLWDISQGAGVDVHSGVITNSDIENMFGGSFGVEPSSTLFQDFQAAPYTHFVEWHTASLITLRSFSLWAQNEGMDRRAFSQFTLYSGDGAGSWNQIYTTGPGFIYDGVVEIESNLSAPVVAQYFRAEFEQAPWIYGNASGTRIYELDGYDTFIGGTVPIPGAFWLLVSGLVGFAGFRSRTKKRER